MFKVYKWLGYYLLRPYKRFEHLLKFLAIYFAKLNKLQKNRKERLNRIKKKTYLAPRREEPTQPSRPTRAGMSSSPPRTPKLLGGMPPSQPGVPPRHLPAWSLPGVLIVPWRRARVPRLHSPPPELSPLPPPLVSSPPAASPERTAVVDVATVP